MLCKTVFIEGMLRVAQHDSNRKKPDLKLQCSRSLRWMDGDRSTATAMELFSWRLRAVLAQVVSCCAYDKSKHNKQHKHCIIP